MATTKVTTDVIDMSGNTGGLVWAKGTTAQQPAVGVSTAGDLRGNTETFRTEVFNGTDWRNLKEAPGPPVTVDFLVVAAGGASPRGGNNGSANGAGGAGGLRTSFGTVSPITLSGGSMETSVSLNSVTEYDIEVGAASATNGGNSIFSSITSTGGGAGAVNSTGTNGTDGGSGGGAAGYNGASSYGNAVTSPVIQGFRGAASPTSNDDGTAGGGAGSIPGNGLSPGGLGLSVAILNSTNAATAGVGEVSGTDVYYASGGAAGRYSGTPITNTSLGGGGAGTNFGSASGYGDGAANTGGGGGGLSNKSNPANLGGSGVVILRYTSSRTMTVGAGLVEASGSPFTEGASNEFKVSVFTGGTGKINF